MEILGKVFLPDEIVGYALPTCHSCGKNGWVFSWVAARDWDKLHRDFVCPDCGKASKAAMVKRYSYNCSDERIDEDPDGEFVEFSDYDSLRRALVRISALCDDPNETSWVTDKIKRIAESSILKKA